MSISHFTSKHSALSTPRKVIAPMNLFFKLDDRHSKLSNDFSKNLHSMIRSNLTGLTSSFLLSLAFQCLVCRNFDHPELRRDIYVGTPHIGRKAQIGDRNQDLEKIDSVHC